jgi:NADH-quinone oxidoreductase subunit N
VITASIIPQISYWALLPGIILLAGALLLLVIHALVEKPIAAKFWSLITAGIGCLSLIFLIELWFKVGGSNSFSAVDHALIVDRFSTGLGIAIAVVVIIISFLAQGFIEKMNWKGPEFYALILLSSFGAWFMVQAQDFVVLFLGLEIMSIALYVMAGINLKSIRSNEAALKYLILGGLSSAIFIYGVAFIYGATGSTNLADIKAFLDSNLLTHNGVLFLGMALILVGFGFKVSLVPFHLWTPDVYEGSPTLSVAFMSAIAKLGGFGALIRVLDSALGSYVTYWRPIIWVIGVSSLILGSVGGLYQKDVKRILAYSTINHSGFILLGVYGLRNTAIAGSFVYVISYSIFSMASFGVLGLFNKSADANDLSDLAGLMSKDTFKAVAMVIFMLSQAGIPLTIGFVAKLGVLTGMLSANADSWAYAMGIIAMLTAVISAFYYLRIIVSMFGKSDEIEKNGSGIAVKTKVESKVTLSHVGIWLSLIIVLLLGIFPAPILDMAKRATLGF